MELYTKMVIYAFLLGYVLLLSISNAAASSSCCDICLCTPGEVWCEQRNLNTVPRNIPITTRRLYLFNNNISIIPNGVFRQLKNLEALDLRTNSLTSDTLKPEVLEGLANLKDLMLSENKLTRIRSKTFAGTPNLIRLYLKNNLIHTIEDHAFKNLTKLVELKLGNNHLTTIPKLMRSSALRRLCLSNNQLYTLQPKSFEAVDLEELLLSRNQINQLPSTAFGETRNMRLLDVSYNKLTRPPSIISNMTYLHTLNISGNNIASMPVNFLKKLQKIKTLDFRGLQLTTLPNGFIPDRVYLNMLDISDNPWICNCQISWMVDYMRALRSVVANRNEVQCALPIRLKSELLITLSKDKFCSTATTESILTDSRSQERLDTRKPTVDLCDAMACANGAICIVNATTHKPFCRCNPGWKGVLCDTLVAPPPLPPAPTQDETKPSGGSANEGGLFFNPGSVTSYSVDIFIPRLRKNITVTTTVLTSNGKHGRVDSRVIIPTVHQNTIKGLQPGTKYNICIIFFDIVRTGAVKDTLCAVVTTKPLTTVSKPIDDQDDASHNDNDAKKKLEQGQAKNTSAESETKQNGRNSPVSNNDKENKTIMFIVAGTSAGVIIIIMSIAVTFCCKRRKKKLKHANNNHEVCELAVPVGNGRMRKQDTATMATQQYPPTDPQTCVPLLNHNGNYCESALKHNCQSHTASSRRLGTPSKSESLGRISNSGGSGNGSIQRNTERQRCCSKSSDGYYPDQRENGRNFTPPNGNLHIAATYGDMRTNPNNREQESVYNHQGSPTMATDAYADTSFRDPNVPLSVVSVLSSNTNVNHYHHGSIATTAISPRTTFGYHINTPVSMGNYPPGPSVARPQPVAMHYTPTKQLRHPSAPYLHMNSDIYNRNHAIEEQMKNPNQMLTV